MMIHERESASLFHTYKRLPLEILRGEGMYLFAKDGKRYLDMFSGLAVNALGYRHPRIIAAIREQADRYIHLSNYYLQEPQIRLAELLAGASGFGRVFFANSGTETVEGAIKLARKWGSGRQKTDIVSFSNAFHGRTMGALSLMDKARYRDSFGPFLPNMRLAEFNSAAALRKQVTPATAAVILECIQGEGGIVPVSQEFAAEVETLRRTYGFLLIADEIQSGIGRTGKFLAFEHFGLRPDIVLLAKPIGGGLPLGAILGGPAVGDVFQPGMHGTTFGGNPVACAAGIAVIEEIQNAGLIAHAAAMGKLLLDGLENLRYRYPDLVKEARGYGLMAGLQLSREGEKVTEAMRDRGILINCTNTTVLRFLPPLIVTPEQIAETLDALNEVLRTN